MDSATIETPYLNHIKKCDWDFVYEPAEDSFLLLDALEHDLDFIQTKKPGIVVEVGCGSGIIICALSKILNSSSHCLAIDINPHACKITKSTVHHNKTVVDIVQADLTLCLKKSSVDLIIFNPPYVVTPEDEVTSNDFLTKSWAGGTEGVQVINRFLEEFIHSMRPRSFGYLLLLKDNQCDKIIKKLSEFQFESGIILKRKVRGEELFVVKFQGIFNQLKWLKFDKPLIVCSKLKYPMIQYNSINIMKSV